MFTTFTCTFLCQYLTINFTCLRQTTTKQPLSSQIKFVLKTMNMHGKKSCFYENGIKQPVYNIQSHKCVKLCNVTYNYKLFYLKHLKACFFFSW